MTDLERVNTLVIEANQGMRSRLRAMLASFGMTQVQFAPSAGAAVRKLRESRFDLVLCEYNLDDGQDGQHLLEDLRREAIIPLDTLFIMITGERNYERVVSAAELTPNDYILKPLTTETLHLRLERALLKREAFRPIYRLIAIGDTQEAIDACREAESRHPRYALDFMRLRAELLAAAGSTDEAEKAYRQILETRPAPWARLGIAKMLLLKKRHAEAEALLADLVAENQYYLDAYDCLARTCADSGRTEDARGIVADAVKRSPHRLDRLRELGKLSLQVEDHPGAEQAFAEVVRKGKYSDFRDPEDHIRLLQAQLGAGRMAEAEGTIRDLQKSMSGLPTTALCVSLANALYHRRNGDEQKAMAALQGAVANAGQSAKLSVDMKQELVKACLDNRLEDEGSSLVMDILRTAADERTIETTRAVLRERGREDLARQIEQRIHTEVKELITAGAEKASAGDYDGAVQEMMNAVRKMPGNPHVLFNAALALLRHIEHKGWNEGLAAQARSLIARSQRLDPANPRLAAITSFMHGLLKKYGIRPAHAAAGPLRKRAG